MVSDEDLTETFTVVMLPTQNYRDRLKFALEQVERYLLERELEKEGGNVTKVALSLRMSRRGVQLAALRLGINASLYRTTASSWWNEKV